MNTIFMGIKTAFSTSVVGMFTALICLLFNYGISRWQMTFFYQLETFTVEKLLPVTVPRAESENILEDVAFRLQDSFESLNYIITQNNDTLENLNAVGSSFKTIVDEVRNITHREESLNFEKVMGLLADNNKSLVELVNLWPQIVSTMKEHSRLAEGKILTLITTMKNHQDIFDRELNRVLQVRQGGIIINFNRVSFIISILSIITIISVILIKIIK